MNKGLSKTISKANGAIGVLNIPNSNSIGSAMYSCLNTTAGNITTGNSEPFIIDINCNQPSTKSDLEILQDEVKSLTKKVDKLIKQLNK